MPIKKIAGAYHAARRADEARLDAMEAADDAGLPVNWTEGDQIAAIEQAAVTALVAARCRSSAGARLRDETLAAVFANDAYVELLTHHDPLGEDQRAAVSGNGAIQ